jgi:hypothetical protein
VAMKLEHKDITEAISVKVGTLINFGRTKLELKRLVF